MELLDRGSLRWAFSLRRPLLASRRRQLVRLQELCRRSLKIGSLDPYCAGRSYAPRSPALDSGAPAPERPGRLPAALSGAELDRIVAVASAPHDGARRQWPARDRALVGVLAGAGLRATELCHLEVDDFLVEHAPLLKVAGKGGRERRVPVAAEVAAALEAYLAERAARLGPPSPTDRLFVRAGGEPVTRQGLNHHVRTWLVRAGVPKPAGETAHASYAKGLVSRGVPLAAVQALLGHASLATTQVYLRMTGAELTEAAQAAEVRDALRATQERPRP